MFNSKPCLFAASLALLAWGPPAGAGGRGSTVPPVVDSVEVDPVLRHLTLSGKYFGGTKPQVMLGRHQLEVRESTPTHVVARLPAQLRPATYRLSVNNTQAPSEPTSLYLQVLAATAVN